MTTDQPAKVKTITLGKALRGKPRFLRRAGLMPVDLDGLTKAETTKVLALAIHDQHCVAVAASEQCGIRMLFCIHRLRAEADYDAAFAYIARHVEQVYGVKPKASRSVITSASVWDGRLYCNPKAVPFPLPSVLAKPKR